MKSVVRVTTARVAWVGLGFFAVVATLTSFTLVRRAHAAIDDTFLRLGSEALAFPGIESDEPRSIRINGVELHYRVQSIDVPLPKVWSHFAGVCGGRSQGSSRLGPLLRALSVRGASSDEQAYVACLDLHQADLASFGRLARRVATTWDLAHLGAFRYVYARRDDADPTHTLLFTLWANGALDLRAFVLRPSEDTPGSDLLEVPRPRASRRLLSVAETSHRLAVYRVIANTTPEAEARWYTVRLRASGWTITDPAEGASVETDGAVLLVGERGAQTLSVVLSRDEAGSTLVTAHETESR